MKNLKDLRVVYMGTPEFSIKPLEILLKKTNVVLVVTKKDAYVGRKKVLTSSPVKELAINHNIPIFTPDSIKKEYEEVLKYKPDIIITCAYGKIIPKELLEYPKYGCINIHASLLPKYRGASPIQSALLNGEKITGVTLMYMDEGMDTGDIIDKIEYQIKDEDNSTILFEELSELGSKLLEDNLENLISVNIKREKQDNELATYTKMITSEDEIIDFNDKGSNIINKIRALSKTPLAKCKIENDDIKIVSAYFEEGTSEINKLYITKNSLGIGCINGIIYLEVIIPVGKKEMNIKSYLNGKKFK